MDLDINGEEEDECEIEIEQKQYCKIWSWTNEGVDDVIEIDGRIFIMTRINEVIFDGDAGSFFF